jgi:hypothetical protein
VKIRVALIVGAAITLLGPWVYAAIVVASSPKPGSKEDGPFTGATYLSVLTCPASMLLILIALLVVKPPKG